jgi:hypothetical protein
VPALFAVVVVSLITIRCFRMPAPKAENGFVAGENCFVAESGRNSSWESLTISTEYEGWNGAYRVPAGSK